VRQGEDAIATWIEGAIEDGEPLPATRTYETYALAGA
jgi:predicted RNase H-like HicB family nuclease